MVPEKGSPDPDNGARKMVTDNATDNARGGSPTTPRHRQWFLGGVFPEFPGRLKNVLFFFDYGSVLRVVDVVFFAVTTFLQAKVFNLPGNFGNTPQRNLCRCRGVVGDPPLALSVALSVTPPWRCRRRCR